MPPFPLPISELLGHNSQYIVYLIIGFAFGYVLEISAFANAPVLAAQFYLKDMTVLKVMFGAIVTAMVLIFLSTAVGLLDYSLVYVNPTYLWPGIIGGLIMGFGFILGGFCPGTSLVSAAVAKLDGVIFVLGVLFGIFAFGETVQYFEDFWYSSYLGRFTLPELFGVSTGWVVVGIVLMALFMFWGAEQLEHIFGHKDLSKEPKWRYGAAAVLLAGAFLVLILGQPSTEQKWSQMEETEAPRLANREVQISPAELLSTSYDDTLKLILLDIRSEADYNQFHLREAQHVTPEQLPELAVALHDEPANAIVVVMGNDEAAATEAWRTLRAEGTQNLYILEGGVNNWITTFADDDFKTTNSITGATDDSLAFTFPTALGAGYAFAAPNEKAAEGLNFTPKIQLELKRGPGGGGCG
ncbi:MAG: YeeE/YedE thiosulfate transporter family protein [Chloroflexota bacterium]